VSGTTQQSFQTQTQAAIDATSRRKAKLEAIAVS